MCSSSARPDLQIESNHFLGTPTPIVCPPDTSFTPGIQGFPTPDFGPSQAVTNALQDFAQEFVYVTSSGGACTLNLNGDLGFLSLSAGDTNGRQYCAEVAGSNGFSANHTVLTAQVLDGSKNIGPPPQIVIIPKGSP